MIVDGDAFDKNIVYSLMRVFKQKIAIRGYPYFIIFILLMYSKS